MGERLVHAVNGVLVPCTLSGSPIEPCPHCGSAPRPTATPATVTPEERASARFWAARGCTTASTTISLLDALDAAEAERAQVREALGLVPETTAEQVVQHIEGLRADSVRLVRERVDLHWRWSTQVERARAWGRAEGLAEARDRLRRDASDQRRGSEAQRYARRLADDLDPTTDTETP